MHLRLGNLTPEEFSVRTGLEFTPEELEALREFRSGKAELTGPNDFHIFDAPRIAITVGSMDSPVIEILSAANLRTPPQFEIGVYLDEQWKKTVS